MKKYKYIWKFGRKFNDIQVFRGTIINEKTYKEMEKANYPFLHFFKEIVENNKIKKEDKNMKKVLLEQLPKETSSTKNISKEITEEIVEEITEEENNENEKETFKPKAYRGKKKSRKPKS